MSDEALKETVREFRSVPQQSPFAALADELYRERVIRARKTPPEEKILAGQRLFEAACEITLAGIRNQFPSETNERHRQILGERLASRRRRQAKS